MTSVCINTLHFKRKRTWIYLIFLSILFAYKLTHTKISSERHEFIMHI